MWAMYQNLDATADNVAVQERCPTVDTTPGTVRPILGYSLR